MHLNHLLSGLYMEGPLVEVNPTDSDFEWNGAIAFLDRDGVLNYGSPNYINHPNEMEVIEGAKEAISALKSLGYRIVIVTNQSAIIRGKWGPEMLEKIHQRLQELIGTIDVIMTCPHRSIDRCDCRKPQPGMLNEASMIVRNKCHTSLNWFGNKPKPIHQLDLMVGDRKSDMGAGWAVGARLFQVNENLGIASVIDRIISNDLGDDFNPVN